MKPHEPLPGAAEREHLLDALAELVERAGWQHFVSAPIVKPLPEYFPDRWTPDAAGVHRLARRILVYAGLEDLDADVELFEDVEPDPGADAHSVRHRAAAAWFAGIEGTVCRFGANVDKLADPLGVTAAMAHECAHAFRFARGLVVEDLQIEEQLTDLTTVYLGFGLMSVNAAARHSSWNPDGEMRATAWSFESLGYLSPQALSFLLAAQLELRGVPAREVRGHLETNQASYVDKARRWLRKHVPDLAGRLGVPDRARWPAPRSLEALSRPLGEPNVRPDRCGAPTRHSAAVGGDPEPASERLVDRVPFSRGFGLAVVGLVAGFVLVVITAALGNGPLVGGLVGAAGLVVVGRRLGSAWPRWECSHCRISVRRSDPTCRGCGGRFVRDLKHADDRLEDGPVDADRIPAMRGYRDENAGTGFDPALVDGSGLPNIGGVLLVGRDQRRARPEDVDKLRRRLDVQLPDGYELVVVDFGEGTFCECVELWVPQRVISEQVRALDPLRKGELSKAPPGIDPRDPEGFTILGEAGRDDLVATHRAHPGRWLLLRRDTREVVDVGEAFGTALEQIVDDPRRPVTWFVPASVAPRTRVTGRGASLHQLIDAMAEFGPMCLISDSDESDPADAWIVLIATIGAVVYLERTGATDWTIELCTDSEHKDAAQRMVSAFGRAGLDVDGTTHRSGVQAADPGAM